MPWQVGDYVAEGEKPFDQGSFGTIWRARRVSDGARVALKLVLLTEAADAREKIAAERHGAMLQQQFEQAHGMVPRVYDYGHDGDDFFIAMELVEGGALADLLKRGPIEPRLAARHAIRICEFLERAHGFATSVEGEPYDRLVHADLKPGHVLIDDAGGIKVLDFGIAKALAKTTQVTTNNWGTSAYASPERLDHGHVNEHVDHWSLGVMLYEMVSGRRPYQHLDRNRSQLEHAIRTNAPREALPAACPTELAAIICKMLAYQIDRRYPTAAAIKADLELFLAGGQPSAAAEFITPPTMPIGRPGTLPGSDVATARLPLRGAVRPPLAMSGAALASTPLGATIPWLAPPGGRSDVPPTDPLPLAGSGQAATAHPSMAPPVRRSRVGAAVAAGRRTMWAVSLLVIVGFVLTEGLAWMAAGRFRNRIDAIDGQNLADFRQDYERLAARSRLDAGLRLRVDAPLTDRLVKLADSVIADYRREAPVMGPVEWKQAQESLRWASLITPRDQQLRSRLLTAEAHVIRLSARGQPPAAARLTYRRAIEKFRAAADMDARSFDPYLGISRIEVYALGDVDDGIAAVQEAEKRGHVSGRPERALLGDGYLKRAQSSRAVARTLSGEQRRRELEKARADYNSCIAAFDPIVGFGRAAENLEICKRQLQQLDDEMAALDGALARES